MFYKLIQFAVALGWPTLSFQTAAFVFPSSEWSSPSPETYRLPNNTKPETIFRWARASEKVISIRWTLQHQYFGGDYHLSDTIHSEDSKIEEILLCRSGERIEPLPWQSISDTQFLIIPTKKDELQSGSRYRLDINGFLRTIFDWLAVSFSHFL